MVCVPFGAYAEVMDKEPPIFLMWAIALICSVAGFLFAKRRSWFVVATLLPLFFYVGVIFEIHDPQVGPAIFAEAGTIYIASAYAALIVLLVAHMAGWASRQTDSTDR